MEMKTKTERKRKSERKNRKKLKYKSNQNNCKTEGRITIKSNRRDFRQKRNNKQ